MNTALYDDVALERIVHDTFGLTIDIDNVILRASDVSRTARATVLLSKKRQLLVYIEASSPLLLGDVKKIISRMGLKAELYMPPKGQPHYFDDIGRRKFSEVFPQMFGGGSAELRLTDPENLLTTGIEIIAQPPGKKLQQLSLLSGGERAFTAIALMFSIIQVRPVPFCILDEVEAALDEVNVDNFGKFLNEFKNKTQFIVITHKKKTMEYADVLYGITMQESGVSKLVSVKLEDIKDDKES